MDNKTFFTWLFILTASTAVLLGVLLWLLPAAALHWKLAVASLALFVLICVGLFFSGRNAAGSKSKLAFNNLVSASVFGKMIVSVAFLFVYQELARPANSWFVGIFLLTYVVYTVFEVWFMTKLAKT